MIFTKKQNFGVTHNTFLNEQYISYTNFNRLKTKDGISIGSATAIDRSKQISLLKSYNEFLERYRLAFPNFLDNFNIKAFDIISKDYKNDIYKNFGYGRTDYGYNDTTGTATGNITNKLIHKAITELLEKNDLLIFWYGNNANVINITKEIAIKIKEFNFYSDSIFLFYSQGTSNLKTFFVILFKNKKFIASGISCNQDDEKGLDRALAEAKIIEWQNLNNPLSGINNLSLTESEEAFRFINYKQQNSKKVNLIFTKETLIFKEWISDLNVCLLSGSLDHRSVTVKACSRDLISCLPRKDNIDLIDTEITILKKYYDKNKPNCILV